MTTYHLPLTTHSQAQLAEGAELLVETAASAAAAVAARTEAEARLAPYPQP